MLTNKECCLNELQNYNKRMNIVNGKTQNGYTNISHQEKITHPSQTMAPVGYHFHQRSRRKLQNSDETGLPDCELIIST